MVCKILFPGEWKRKSDATVYSFAEHSSRIPRISINVGFKQTTKKQGFKPRWRSILRVILFPQWRRVGRIRLRYVQDAQSMWFIFYVAFWEVMSRQAELYQLEKEVVLTAIEEMTTHDGVVSGDL